MEISLKDVIMSALENNRLMDVYDFTQFAMGGAYFISGKAKKRHWEIVLRDMLYLLECEGKIHRVGPFLDNDKPRFGKPGDMWVKKQDKE